MSYSDRKEGNWDYQRVSGQLKAQEKAQKEAIKAAEKAQKKAAKSSRRSYSAPKNLTVDQVMADYNSWEAKQPKTAEQVMADYDSWNQSTYGAGNIDLHNRPQYKQPDGSISTVNSISFNDNGKEVLVPTIAYDANGKAVQLSDDDAINRYYDTGEYLGKFDTVDEANAYAEKLHKDQEAYYMGNRQNQPAPKSTKKEQKKQYTKEEIDAFRDYLNGGATRVTYDPWSQERPDPTAITKGKEIPVLNVTDPSNAYNQVVEYKEALRKEEKEKQRQAELLQGNKQRRLEKQMEHAQEVKDERDQTYRKGRYQARQDFGTGLSRAVNKIDDTIRRKQDDLYGRMTDEELAAEAERLEESAIPFAGESVEKKLLDREIEDRKLRGGMQPIAPERTGPYVGMSDEDLLKEVASLDPLHTSRMGFNENMQRRALGNELSYRNAQAFQEATTKRPEESDLEYLQRMQTQVSPEQATAMLAQVRRNAQVPDEAEASELVNKPDFTEKDRNIALEILNEYDQDTIRKNRTLSALRERVMSDNAALAFTAGVDSQLMNRYYAADRAVANLTGGNNLSERTAALDPMSGYTQNRIMAANAANAGNIQEAEMLNNAADEQARKYNFKEGTQAAARDNGLAYGAGRIAGAVGENMMVGNLLSDAGWTVNTGNKVADFLGNQGIKLIPDIVSDTIPTVAEAYDEGQRGLDLAKTAGLNVLENELYNLGTDYLLAPAFNKIFGGAKQASPEYLNSLREYQQNVLEPLAREADDAAAAAQTAAKNVDVDNLATAGRQTVNNLDELAEQATKQAPIEQVKPIAPAASTAEEVVEQAAKTDVAPNGLRYPEQDNPIIDSIETARKGMEEGIPKATSQLDTHQMQVDNVLSKYDFNANEETKVLLDAVQGDYKTYRKVIQVGDTEAADTAAKKLRSDLGKLHRRAEKYVPDYKGELNIRDITQGSNYPAYSIRNMKNAKIDADSVMNNWNNSFLASEFGEMTREQYDAFLKEAQDLGWVDELGNPTKEALGSIPSSEYDDILSQYDDIVKNALEQGNTERDTAASILDSLEKEQKAGRVYLDEKEWYDMVGAANDYARTGEKQYLEQMNDIISGKRAVEPSVNTAPVKAEPVNNVVSGNDIRERNYGKNARIGRIEGVPDEVAAEFVENPEIYNVLHNADTIEKAQKVFDQGLDKARNSFDSMLIRHDPAAIPLGQSIARELSANGDYDGAAEVIRRMSQELTSAGQFSQAAAITLMKNDPMTALHYITKQVDALNNEGLKVYGSKWKNFALTEDEIKSIADIKPGDEKAIKEAWDAIGKRMSMEYPSTMMDKLLEGRKISMLLNFRTLIRNPVANVPMLPLRWTADRFEAVGQNVAHLIDPNIEVTQSLTGSGIRGRRLSNKAWKSERVQNLVKGTPGKYEVQSIKNAVAKNATVYKGTFIDHWIDDMTGKGIEKFAKRFLNKDIKVDGGIQALNKWAFGKEGVRSTLETLRNLTYKLLDIGDSPFVKENFVERLGSYINAQNIKSVEDIPDEAIRIAWEEAMKATYKDNSWAVQMLQGIRNAGIKKVPGVGKPLAEGSIPFVQAPGNIAARMVDYSVLGGGIGIKDIIKGARSGNKDLVIKGIEEASKGLSGTALAYLGIKLHQAGIITGTYSTDKDMKQFQKQTGYREFAIHVGDNYYTYDWAQPFAQSLMVGTLLDEAIQNSDQYDSDLLNALGYEGTDVGKFIGGLKQSAYSAVNSWFDESPLQGLQKLMNAGYSDEDGIAGNVVDALVTDFAQSFVPASINSMAKSLDPFQRNTYNPNYFKQQANTIMAKIPGMTEDLPIKYDTWGRPLKTGETVGDAFIAKHINPGDYSYDRSTDIDKEIMRLYEEVDNDVAVFPPVVGKTVGDRALNGEEMSAYQEDMGKRNYNLVEGYMDTDAYENTSDANKVEVIKDLYGASKAISERDLFDKKVSDSSTYKKYVDIYDEYGEDGLIDYIDKRDSSKIDIKDSLQNSDAFDEFDKDTKKKILGEVDTLSATLAKADLGEDVDDKRVGIYEKYGADTLADYLVTKEKSLYKTKNGSSTSSVYSTVMAMRDLSKQSLKRLMPELLNFEKQNGELNSNAEIYGKYGPDVLLKFYLNGYRVTGTKEMPKDKMEANKAAQMFPEEMQEDIYNYYLNRQTTTIHASSSKAEQEVLDNQGMGGLQEFIRQEDTLKEFGSYEYDDTAQKIFNEGGYPALKEYGATLQGLESRGVKGKSAYESYTHAIQQVPSLSMDQFSKEYKWIDSLGEGDSKDNGSVSQAEILAAMNSRPREAEQIQKKYWTSDSYVPILENGTWKKKKVKKKK